MKSVKVILLAALLGLVSVSAMASSYGVSGSSTAQKNNTAEAEAIQRLLGQANSQAQDTTTSTGNTGSLADQRKTAVPSGLAVKKNNNTNSDAFGDTGVGKQAFSKVVRNLMPLSPAQIKTLRQLFNQTQKAAATYPGIPPRPTSTSVIVNLSPGAAPPVIRLRAGYVTSLVFLDSTGKPWPIVAYDLGNRKAFNIQWNKKGNTLFVQALDTYQSGNLAVMLKGKDTPVMVTLMPGQQAVDYRVDLRVPGFGPNAAPLMSGLPNAANPQLINFLDGVPPRGSKALQITGGAGQSQIWLYGGHLYLRTQLTVLSPSWISAMSSPDGTHVFELNQTPIILASRRGETVRLTVQGLD